MSKFLLFGDMGSGYDEQYLVSNLIFRSTASYVIEHINIPVLVVPMKN